MRGKGMEELSYEEEIGEEEIGMGFLPPSLYIRPIARARANSMPFPLCSAGTLVLSHYAQQGLGELACMCVSERANARNRE